LAARLARGDGRDVARRERRHVVVPALRHLEARPAARAPEPLLVQRVAALDRAAEVRARLVGDVEVLVGVPAVGLLGEPDLLLAERRAVRGLGVLLVRRPRRDVRADDDQRGLVLDGPRVARGLLETVEADVLVEVL